MELTGRIAQVTNGPGGQRVVFCYRNTQYELDYISFFVRVATDFKVGDIANLKLEKVDTASYDDTSWYDAKGRI